MRDLKKVRICHAPLSNRIVLARMGSQDNEALETKDAMNDFWQAFVSYAFGRVMPSVGQSAEIDFGGGDEQFTIVISRVDPSSLKAPEASP